METSFVNFVNLAPAAPAALATAVELAVGPLAIRRVAL